MKILITGGAGYIGSVMTAKLIEEGNEVIVLDNLSQGHADAVPAGVRFIRANAGDIAQHINGEDAVDAVIHLAGFIAAGESMISPETYWRNNTVGTLDLLDGMRSIGIKKLIFASSAAVYGNPEAVPITEEAPAKPTSTYGMTKLAVDMAVTSECLAHGLAATSLRFFNVAGAYEGCFERHPNESHIIPIALEVAAGKRDHFTLFGDDYPTADGTCVRDYIHVVDLAMAASQALQRLQHGKHAIYNLGNGEGYSNRQVIETVEKITEKKLPVTVGPRRDGDPAVLVASSDKARSELGWAPTQPTLEAMVSDAWQYF